MGFFKELKENYIKEYKEEPKNKAAWEVVYVVYHYRFLVRYLNGVRPIQLTIDELIDLYYDLIEYRKTFPEPKEIISIATEPRYYDLLHSSRADKLFKEYPWLFIGRVIERLGSAIELGYQLDKNESIKYRVTDDEKIEKYKASPCSECQGYLELNKDGLCSSCSREE